MISAQFPPISNPNPITNSTAETQPATAETAATVATSTASTTTATSEDVGTESLEKTEDVPKTNIPAKTPADDQEAGPSTAQKTNTIETLEIDGNIVTIEDIADLNDSSDAMSEIRRRRLQKFELKSEDS